jgi:RNA polymerase sigma-54 factor
MKPALQLRMSQSLTLTPQLRQAIKLLTLSAQELEAEVQEALESNPLLDLETDDNDPRNGPEIEPAHPLSLTSNEQAANLEVNESRNNESAIDIREETASSETADGDEAADFDTDFSLDWQHSGDGHGGSDDEDDARESARIAHASLHEYLLWQWQLCRHDERSKRIGEIIIDAMDDDGYLRESAENLASVLGEPLASHESIEIVRRQIGLLDPPGCASRTLSECLLLQMTDLRAECAEFARTLVRHHLESLGRAGVDRLAQKLGVSEELFSSAVRLIRTLRPKPGAIFDSAPTEYVVPDVYVRKLKNVWEVHLNRDCLPKLKLNDYYQGLIRNSSRDTAGYLKGRLQEARWLMKSLEQREDTVLRVAKSIVARQVDFFERGNVAMKPLVLRQIAEEVELHESTISRVTTRKYMHTPRGVFEFKHFFSSSLATEDGGNTSSTAIQAMIRGMIDEETPHKPMSDNTIADLLKEQGFLVARRTVAKYREGMGIASSTDRVRLK